MPLRLPTSLPARAALLVALNLIAYSNSFTVPFIFDDHGAIVNNPGIRKLFPIGPALRGPEGMGTAGRPVVNYSFAINYAISGMDTWSYHAINLMIHAANALLLMLIIEAVMRGSGRRAGTAAAAAWLAAAAWSLNPMQTQSVTYLVIRNESLMAFFFLLALRAHQLRGEGSRLGAAVAPLACLLGMACKEVMAAAPLVLMLYSWIGPRRGLRGKAYWGACFGSWAFLGYLLSTQPRSATTGLGLEGVTPWSYALTQSHVLPQYLSRWLWPAPLVFDYFDRPSADVLSSVLIYGPVVLLLVAWVARGVIRREMRVLGPACALLILAPSSSFFPIREPAWDYRFYLPSAFVALALAQLLSRRSIAPLMQRTDCLVPGTMPTILLLSGCMLGTFARNMDYSSERRIFEDTLRKRPGNYRVHYNLAMRLLAAGDGDAARTHAEEAVRLKHDYPAPLLLLGRLDLEAGRLAEARARFQRAIELKPNNPDAHLQMADLEARAGNLGAAERHLGLALAAQPSNVQAQAATAMLKLALNQPTAALESADRALALDPANATALQARGQALAALGRMEEAVAALARAAELAPGDPAAQHSLGIVLARLGRWAEAERQFGAALRLRPGDPEYTRDLERARRMLKSAP